MGYARAALQRDVRREEAELQKQAKKKSLWGSIGRTVGSLGVMAVSGGTLNPVTLGLLTGGASFLGGKIGSKASGVNLRGGEFFKDERAGMEKELSDLNLTSSLKSGLQSGFGQATKLYRAGSRAKELGVLPGEVSKIRKGVGFGESFKESWLGKKYADYADYKKQAIMEGQRSRISTNIPESIQQMPTDPSFEYGYKGSSRPAKDIQTTKEIIGQGTYRAPGGEIVDSNSFYGTHADLESFYGDSLYGPNKDTLPSSNLSAEDISTRSEHIMEARELVAAGEASLGTGTGRGYMLPGEITGKWQDVLLSKDIQANKDLYRQLFGEGYDPTSGASAFSPSAAQNLVGKMSDYNK